MASKKQIFAELGRMSTIYRSPLEEVEMLVLLETWENICKDMSDSDFVQAVQEHCKRSKYFPAPASILELHDELHPNSMPVFSLPEETHSPEEIHRNGVNCFMQSRTLTTPEQRKYFNRLVNWDDKHAYAAEVLSKEYPKHGDVNIFEGKSISRLLGLAPKEIQ